jgi:radical SAM protein with 4Fe4S-binding SPASM domain
MDENINEIWQVYKQFNDVEFFFKPALDYILVGEGDKLKGSHIGVSQETLDILIRFTEEYIRDEFSGRKTLIKSIQKYFYLYQLEFMKNPKSLPIPCAAGFSTVAIQYDGGVYPCTMSGAAAVGNIKDMAFDDIWYSDKMRNMRAQVKLGRCRCWTACNMYPALVLSKWWDIGMDYISSKVIGR